MATEKNVHQTERLLSVASGSALVAFGIMRRHLPVSLAAIAGGAPLLWRGLTGHCPAYSALNINTAEHATEAMWSKPAAPATPRIPIPTNHTNADQAGVDQAKAISVEQTITVDQPVAEVFRFWGNFENLPKFMHYLNSVKMFQNGTSHWEAKAPLGLSISWDAEIADAKLNEYIAWRSLPNSTLPNQGRVEFNALSDEQTEVRVQLDYQPPAGAVGEAVAKLFGNDPQKAIAEDLERFRKVIEDEEERTAVKANAVGEKPNSNDPEYSDKLKVEAKTNKEESLENEDKAVDTSFPASDPPATW